MEKKHKRIIAQALARLPQHVVALEKFTTGEKFSPEEKATVSQLLFQLSGEEYVKAVNAGARLWDTPQAAKDAIDARDMIENDY
jgi:hypothetical protein